MSFLRSEIPSRERSAVDSAYLEMMRVFAFSKAVRRSLLERTRHSLRFLMLMLK